MPDIRDEECDVTRIGDQRYDRLTVVGERHIISPVTGRRLARSVTSWNDAGRTGFDRHWLEQHMDRHREDGIGNLVGPFHIGWTRNVGAGVAMPASAAMGDLSIRWVAPRRIGNDVTVLANQRFDHIENVAVANQLLHHRAAVQYCIAVLVGVVGTS